MYRAVVKCCDSKSTVETVDLNENLDVSQKPIQTFRSAKLQIRSIKHRESHLQAVSVRSESAGALEDHVHVSVQRHRLE